jgi:hypothetical protein
MVGHLCILATYAPRPSLDNVICVVEFHNHLVFMPHCNARQIAMWMLGHEPKTIDEDGPIGGK